MTITEKIGIPALLEQTAEECSELAQACLKYARYLRGENPTPKTEEELRDSINEEIADVILCNAMLHDQARVINYDTIHHIAAAKELRWCDRLKLNEENS